MSDQDDDDKVGYKRPPRHSRFAKGTSGNPKGRPRRDRSAAAADRLLDEPCIWLTDGGRQRRITGREAMYRGKLKAALGGDVASAIALLTEEMRLMSLVADAIVGPPKKKSDRPRGFIALPEIASIEEWESVAVPSQRRLAEQTRAGVG